MPVCGAGDDGGRKALFVMIRNVRLARRERLAYDVPGADTAIRTTDHHDQPGPVVLDSRKSADGGCDDFPLDGYELSDDAGDAW